MVIIVIGRTMTGVKEISAKINSIKNMQKITKAMEMVAASKMRQTQERIIKFSAYTTTMFRIINHVAQGNLEYHHSYIEKRKIKNVGYLIIFTDRGLCGALNSNLLRLLLIDINKWAEKKVNYKLAFIGAKGFSLCNEKMNIVAHMNQLEQNLSITPLKVLIKLYNEKKIDIIYILNNKFVNLMSQIPQIIQLLPISNFYLKDEKNIKKNKWDYLYESDAKILLSILIDRYIETQLYQKLIENSLCEQAARMLAMKTATDNGSRIINDLNILYNNVRQANITQEIIEIVSGAGAV